MSLMPLESSGNWTDQITDAYYKLLAKIESSNNPNAKASTSSASGLYQFTKGTWTSLGYAWSDVFNSDLQNEAIRKLTSQNASILDNSGISINAGSLYAAHFLGAGTATDVLGHSDSTPISDIVSSGVIKANSFLKNMDVGDFKSWLTKKTGDVSVVSDGSVSSIIGAITSGAGLSGPFSAAFNSAKDVATTAVDLVKSPAEGALSWVKEFFSANTAARATAVVIGISLVCLAIYVLINQSETFQKAAKSAAMA